MLSKINRVDILSIDNKKKTEKKDIVAVEHCLQILSGNSFNKIIHCSPDALEELVIGYLHTIGLIVGVYCLKSIKFSADLKTVYFENDSSYIEKKVSESKLSIDLSTALYFMNEFLNKSDTFISTGAVHSSAIIYKNELCCFAEDIGRHNALDKTIGYALKSYIPLKDSIILTTGRLPLDMINKVLYTRSPIIISRSAPTNAAINLAEEYNITLCGFARENRINIYTGKERIII